MDHMDIIPMCDYIWKRSYKCKYSNSSSTINYSDKMGTVVVAVLTLLLRYSIAAAPGCNKFSLEGASYPYAAVYNIAPSFNRNNGRNVYIHERENDIYVFYAEAGSASGWHVAQSTLYANDSAGSLEGVASTWEESGIPNPAIKFTCIEAICSHLIVDHVDDFKPYYTGVYDVQRGVLCNGRPTYRSDYYWLFYTHLGPDWQGWVASRYTCNSNRESLGLLAYSTSYHVEAIGSGWEVLQEGAWRYDPDVSVMCQADPEPTPVSCDVWRKTAIGLGSGVAIVIVITMSFIMYGLDCYTFTHCCMKDADSDLSSGRHDNEDNDEDSSQRQPLNRSSSLQRSPNHNALTTPTFVDMAVMNNNAEDESEILTGVDGFNGCLVPPPDYDTAIRSPHT